METASWVFGGLFAVFIMAVVGYRVFAPNSRPIDETTHKLLGFLCAILAGLFAFFFTGTVAAQATGNAGNLAGLSIQATGGAALFVIMLVWWRRSPPLPAQDKTVHALGTTLGIVDRVYPQMRAVVRNEDVPTTTDNYSVQASQQGNQIIFSHKGGGSFYTITGDDLKRLPRDDQQFINAVEKSMEDLAGQWANNYAQRNSGDAAQRDATKTELRRLATQICTDLQKIFSHLGSIGAVLEDHYGAMRSICSEVQNQAGSQIPAAGTQAVFNTNIHGNVNKQTNINKVDGDVSI